MGALFSFFAQPKARAQEFIPSLQLILNVQSALLISAFSGLSALLAMVSGSRQGARSRKSANW